MRKTTQEITKALNGAILVVTWEWRNGWTLTGSRPAAAAEVTRFNAGDGLPISLYE
jgi:hypothetical protein